MSNLPASTQRTRVALVCMPFAGVDRPAIGASLLKGVLHEHGYGADVLYFNILFAQLIGVEPYFRLCNYDPSTPDAEDYIPYTALAGEWAFSQAFFGLGSLD